MMMLVIDVTKGFQTQTAEGLVIGELTTERLLVVLNKVDQLPADGRDEALVKMRARIARSLAPTRFANAPMVVVSALKALEDRSSLDELVRTLGEMVREPKRSGDGPLLFSADHCFAIKGQGTVLTGTVLSGCVRVNQVCGDTPQKTP